MSLVPISIHTFKRLSTDKIMKLNIEIELDNSAFALNVRKMELNRILVGISDRVYFSTSRVEKIRDSNGNTVGSFKLTK